MTSILHRAEGKTQKTTKYYTTIHLTQRGEANGKEMESYESERTVPLCSGANYDPSLREITREPITVHDYRSKTKEVIPNSKIHFDRCAGNGRLSMEIIGEHRARGPVAYWPVVYAWHRRATAGHRTFCGADWTGEEFEVP